MPLFGRLPVLSLCAPRIARRNILTGAAIQAPIRSTITTQTRAQSSTDGQTVSTRYPIIQLPARNLWCRQSNVSLEDAKAGVFASLFDTLVESRKFYQYPSLSAPQIGWNVRVLTLFDDSVYINPDILEVSVAECWAWEPCASCPFIMHFIKRPKEVKLSYFDKTGAQFTQTFSKMRARFILHEMDHLDGILFTRRIPDTQHVVPLDGFNSMSDWPDDYPSLEARSTFLYSTFTPPYYFESDEVLDANLLDRKFEDLIYPGFEHDAAIRINTEAYMEQQREAWEVEKEAREGAASGQEASTMIDLPKSEDDQLS